MRRGQRLVCLVAAVATLGLATSQGWLLAQDAKGKIEAGKPSYLAKPKEFWKDRGRIVGLARGGPDFTIVALDASGKEVKSGKVQAGKADRKVYEIEWLEPGTYSLRVAAEGFNPLQVDSLEVRPNQDVRIDLEFTR